MINTRLLKIVFGITISLSLITCKSPVDPINDENDEDPGWMYIGLKEEDVGSILIHPENPEIIFAGTGFDFSAQHQGKIFRSTDGGETWETVYEGGSFHGLLFHPENPDIIFAWAHRQTGGLLRSTDGGDTWHLYSEGMYTGTFRSVVAMVINPENPRIMYASTGGIGGGNVYKTTNGGRLWLDISGNHPAMDGGRPMFIHPDQPDLLLHSSASIGIMRTEDGGETWERVFTAHGLIRAYALNPDNPDQIIAGTGSSGEGLLVSDDRGRTWRVEDVVGPTEVFIDVKFIDKSVYAATIRGVLKTDDFKNYETVGSMLLGYTDEGEPVYFPRWVRTIVSDPLEQYLYIGDGGMHFDDEVYRGIYVRRID